MKAKNFFLTFIIFLAGISVGYYFGYDIGFERATEKYQSEAGTPVNQLRIGGNAIYLSDQKPGSSLIVNFVNIEKGGYVVIHKSVEGKPGHIIGHSHLLNPGQTNDFSLTLSQPSQDGEELIAMLHQDNGDAVFNPVNDQPVKDQNDNIIFMVFSVISEAEKADAISL